MARECKIDLSGGEITVKLSADNGIISGGDFSIYDFNTGAVILSFKMHIDTTGTASHDVPLPAADLVDKVLSWQVLNCSPIITDKSNLDIAIYQDDKFCTVNPPAHYALKNIPNCAVGQALPVKGGLHFIK